ncbi:C40 family peptidase [Lactobacillus corticis]|uniref:Cell wall-associated hydrolase n=1 Tax=Lactobacillus corticis TaxID=2201249 RepID=A0A916QI93_9LACO|nr:C40 family peptidase [Lactobacillus corticis]GFZ26798.1 cell wall-associated hydrolase [Lactobacillus corticis]
MKSKKFLVKVLAFLFLFTVGSIAISESSSHEVQAASITTKRNRIVKWANKQVGKRYVWGATGPFSFDCSGLTQYVYKKAVHKNITRTTYSQVYRGRTVSRKHLKKGDLLFWGSKYAPYHVGIYVGGGKYVHAATPSQGVVKQRLSRYFYPSLAKRVL